MVCVGEVLPQFDVAPVVRTALVERTGFGCSVTLAYLTSALRRHLPRHTVVCACSFRRGPLSLFTGKEDKPTVRKPLWLTQIESYSGPGGTRRWTNGRRFELATVGYTETTKEDTPSERQGMRQLRLAELTVNERKKKDRPCGNLSS